MRTYTKHRKVLKNIGKTLLIYVFLLSSVITLLTTSVQLFVDYNEDINRLNKLSSQIQTGYLKGLSSAAWNLDFAQIKALLDGLTALPDVNYAAVFLHEEQFAESGKKRVETIIEHEWDIYYQNNDRAISVGSLHIEITKENAYKSLIDNIKIVLLLNFTRTFFVASFILFFVDYLITRHLRRISQSVQTIHDFDEIAPKITLLGNRNGVNELDIVVSTINELFTNLQRSWEELKTKESNYHQLLENSQIGIIICSPEDVEFQNTMFLNQFNYETSKDIKKDVFQSYLHDFSNIPKDDNENIYKYTRIISPKVNELDLKDANGNTKTLECSSFPTIWNQKLATILFFNDISEKKELMNKAKQQEALLIQTDKMNSLGVMVSSVTHEINNPNQLMRVNMDIIHKSWQHISPILDRHFSKHPEHTILNIPYKEMRNLIPEAMHDNIDASFRIQHIIKDLKNFIRPDKPLDKTNCDINQILTKVLKTIQIHTKNRNISMEFNQKTDCPVFSGHSSLLNQVFVNLLLNAVEASPSESEPVIVSSDFDDKSIIVTIEDRGIGISPESLPKIFDLFHSSKTDTGGTGIGLAIVHNIITQHKGSVEVKNNATKGATFTVKLPLLPKDNESPEITTSLENKKL